MQFNIYINSLQRVLSQDNPIAYANDVTLVASGDCQASACQSMHTLLQAVNESSMQYGLAVSPTKCYTMFISQKLKKNVTCHKNLTLTLDSALPTVFSLRILGVMFTSNLCWSVHKDAIRKKVVSITGVIHRFGNIFNMDCRKKLINVFVMTLVCYCLLASGNLNARSATKVDALLLRVARLVLHEKTAELNTNTYEATGFMSIKSLLFLSNVCCISYFLQ